MFSVLRNLFVITVTILILPFCFTQNVNGMQHSMCVAKDIHESLLNCTSEHAVKSSFSNLVINFDNADLHIFAVDVGQTNDFYMKIKYFSRFILKFIT